MTHPRYIPLILKQIYRHPARSLLTIAGIAVVMFLFIAISAMQSGAQTATQASAEDNTLVVYREDRFCPFTSRLPEYYVDKIQDIPNVKSAIPMKIVVNNCRASLDVVTFRGVPKNQFIKNYIPNLNIIDGSAQNWEKRSDAALLGQTLAKRRKLNVGDRFDAAGVTAYVAGIIDSDQPQDQNVAYVHLDFLQQTADKKLGVVTQFNVTVKDPQQLDKVADDIDQLFKSAEYPTATRSEKAFVAQVAADMLELIDFTQYLAYGCLFAVLALIANAIILSVQGRIKEHAILQTLGFRGPLIGRLIITEGIILSLIGAAIGMAAALITIRYSQFSLSVDGLSIPINANLNLFLTGLLIAVTLGALAGLVPAVQAARRPIAHCFRAV